METEITLEEHIEQTDITFLSVVVTIKHSWQRKNRSGAVYFKQPKYVIYLGKSSLPRIFKIEGGTCSIESIRKEFPELNHKLDEYLK